MNTTKTKVTIAHDEVLAARELSPVLRREIRKNGPAWRAPFRVQTLDTRTGETSSVEEIHGSELRALLAAEPFESWLPEGQLEQVGTL